MNLVVGASGYPGAAICRGLVEHGEAVRVLVRAIETSRGLQIVPLPGPLTSVADYARRTVVPG